MHLELSACLAGEQQTMLDMHMASMLRGHALDLFPSASRPAVTARADALLCTSLTPLTSALQSQLTAFKRARPRGGALATSELSLLDALHRYILDAAKDAGNVCSAWLSLSRDSSQPRHSYRSRDSPEAFVKRWLITPSLAGGHRTLPLQARHSS